MKSLIVAKYTFLELLRSKVLISSLLGGLAIIFTSYIATEFSYGNPSKVSLDIGLGVMSIISMIIAVFMGVSLISTEIESRNVYQVLSRDCSRFSYLSGKYLGLISVLCLNIFILGLVTCLMFIYYEGILDSLIAWAILFTIMESVILLSVVLFFSIITNKVLAIILSVSFYLTSYLVNGALGTWIVENTKGLESLLEGIKLFFPDLVSSNVKDYVLYGKFIDSSNLIGVFAGHLSFVAIIWLMTQLIFKRKDLY